MDKHYNHQEHEDKIYRAWEKSKAFTPRKNKNKIPFSIIMPPPNANGSLHIGHSMFVTLEDVMTRYQRMKGKNVLLLPGADHAGILTQVVFERALAKAGKSRFDLGRKKFYKQCFKFTQDNKKIMYKQLKKIGASCDWTREKFTLDPDISKQVVKTFIKLYKDRLVYRSHRMINWCPRCMTSLSDLEVIHQEIAGRLYFIKYPLVTHSYITNDQLYIMVATTRPETMLGDTAVAVHPEDSRYKQFIGQSINVPLINRKIPIIADKHVDIEFGTGAVKVTPAHDPNDFEMAKRHKLPNIRVIDFNNKMTAEAGEFADMKLKEARGKIIKKLQKKDLLVNTKNFKHQVGHCERCKTTIEPQISLQWFIKVKPLAKKAISAVKNKKINIIPKRFKKNYFNWMENLHDWCISRQIWWGHRMPVWYCGSSGLSDLQKAMNSDLLKNNHKSNSGCGHMIIGMTKPRKCPNCRKTTGFIQDPDTFDTWFSSGQWPYTTLGFKAQSGNSKLKVKSSKLADYDYFYPTNVLETGYEILFFWVARMIMLGLYRTKQVPFKTVYLHGLVRDAFGEKMSKSKGNVINPLGVIEKFGADALRMALVVGASPGNDISLGEAKIKGYRNFSNKVWNIARFILINFPKNTKSVPFYKKNMKGLTKKDEQIINKLNSLIKKTTQALDELKFSPAGEDIYHFVWHELADKYIESVKPRLLGKDKAALSVLRHVLINCLKLLHPFMPFVSEAIFSKIPKKSKDLLIVSSWPEA